MKDLFNPSLCRIMQRHSFYRHCFIVNKPNPSLQAPPAKISYSNN
jgi:hypothetical protein